VTHVDQTDRVQVRRAFKFRAYPTQPQEGSAPSGSGRWAYAAFQAVGTVKVRQHRPVPGVVKTLQLTREHRRWYVIVVADTEPTPLPPAARGVGVDVGVAVLDGSAAARLSAVHRGCTPSTACW
jgi:transposase